MSKNANQISKLLSFWLRHNPKDANLNVDPSGWVSVDQLLAALKIRGHNYNLKDLVELNSSFDKVRWQFDEEGKMMRCTHGHSYSISIDDRIAIPPATLYHGTSLSSTVSILNHGLKPMDRQFVHLSTDIKIALEVGRRYGNPILFEVDSELMYKQGATFYRTNEDIWLTNDVPATYLNVGPWHTVDMDEKKSLLKELTYEISTTHILNSKTKTIELILRRYDMDDCLFIDQSGTQVYVVHLTWSKIRETTATFPQTIIYKSLEEWVQKGLMTDLENYIGE